MLCGSGLPLVEHLASQASPRSPAMDEANRTRLHSTGRAHEATMAASVPATELLSQDSPVRQGAPLLVAPWQRTGGCLRRRRRARAHSEVVQTSTWVCRACRSSDPLHEVNALGCERLCHWDLASLLMGNGGTVPTLLTAERRIAGQDAGRQRPHAELTVRIRGERTCALCGEPAKPTARYCENGNSVHLPRPRHGQER